MVCGGVGGVRSCVLPLWGPPASAAEAPTCATKKFSQPDILYTSFQIRNVLSFCFHKRSRCSVEAFPWNSGSFALPDNAVDLLERNTNGMWPVQASVCQRTRTDGWGCGA